MIVITILYVILVIVFYQNDGISLSVPLSFSSLWHVERVTNTCAEHTLQEYEDDDRTSISSAFHLKLTNKNEKRKNVVIVVKENSRILQVMLFSTTMYCSRSIFRILTLYQVCV